MDPLACTRSQAEPPRTTRVAGPWTGGQPPATATYHLRHRYPSLTQLVTPQVLGLVLEVQGSAHMRGCAKVQGLHGTKPHRLSLHNTITPCSLRSPPHPLPPCSRLSRVLVHPPHLLMQRSILLQLPLLLLLLLPLFQTPHRQGLRLRSLPPHLLPSHTAPQWGVPWAQEGAIWRVDGALCAEGAHRTQRAIGACAAGTPAAAFLLHHRPQPHTATVCRPGRTHYIHQLVGWIRARNPFVRSFIRLFTFFFCGLSHQDKQRPIGERGRGEAGKAHCTCLLAACMLSFLPECRGAHLWVAYSCR